ncbi:MAG: MFS family permease [Candidatus Methanohalarchaeum thermophilum]|uniref:MFS family permease n=1 Tax=Methanohalarchaeum thermophilum TaxID=1903181 RepID=A0A1Q6DSX9_METT1|nr:MAG: MFS family permease [Candidatus Methanohalarchaeum thermophilum]
MGFWNKSLYLILLIAFFGMMGGALMGPVLPALMDPFGVTESRVGLVLGVYTFFTAVTMPFVGSLIDSFGRKKVAFICLVVNGFAGVGCSIASNFVVLLVFRAVQGVGIAGLMPVAMTLIDDLYQEEEKVRAMGRLSTTTAVGGVLAPLLGGSLAFLNWRYPFYFYGLSIPVAIASISYLPDRNKTNLDDEPEKGLNRASELKSCLMKVDLIAILASAFLIFFLLYTIVTFLPMKLVNQLGYTEMEAGIILAALALTGAIVALNIEKISPKSSFKPLISLGFLLTGSGVILLSISPTIKQIIPSLLIFGAGMGLIQPLLNDVVTDLAPDTAVGTTTSIYNTMKYVGQTAAPLFFGWILISTNLNTVFLVSGLIGITGAIIAAIQTQRKNKKPKNKELTR